MSTVNRTLGQFFTPEPVVKRMVALRRNFGTVLEPSAGAGAFLPELGPDAVAVEIDAALARDPRITVSDFFEFPVQRTFDTIIGNPPYVRFQDIGESTRSALPMELFDRRSNLYLFFIAKCMRHLNPGGELIFITPRDFLKATSSRLLNERLYATGSFTHYYELGDARIFRDAIPNCAIWRWERGRADRRMQTGSGARFHCRDGQIWFGPASRSRLGDHFDVKVGAVSGADDVFASEKRGCTDMVCSRTASDGKTRRVIYNRNDPCLLPHKERLLSRKIRQFDESNWWEWGRKFCARPGPRIYVNGKTRNKRPFFVSEQKAYDGSVLALFPKADVDPERAAGRLNAIDWERLGFACDGRLLFTQRSLTTAPVDL